MKNMNKVLLISLISLTVSLNVLSNPYFIGSFDSFERFLGVPKDVYIKLADGTMKVVSRQALSDYRSALAKKLGITRASVLFRDLGEKAPVLKVSNTGYGILSLIKDKCFPFVNRFTNFLKKNPTKAALGIAVVTGVGYGVYRGAKSFFRWWNDSER